MLLEDERVPFLEVFLFGRVEVDEVLEVFAVLEEEPRVVELVLRDGGAGDELDFGERVEEGLFGLGDEDFFAFGWDAFGGGFLRGVSWYSFNVFIREE